MIKVIIPTYNRPESIREILTKSIGVYKGNLFSFEIHDSSPSNDTENYVRKFNNKNQRNKVLYYHYTPDLTVEEKVIPLIRNCKDEFFYLMGDGVLADFNRLENIFVNQDYQKYDIINIEGIFRRGRLGQDRGCKLDRIYEYNDDILYAKKYFSHLTFWGASIIKGAFFRSIFEKGIIDHYLKNNICWWIACCIFEAANCRVESLGECCLGTVYTGAMSGHKYKTDHQWTDGDKYYEWTFKVFNRAVDLLPERYKCVSEDIIIFFRKDSLVSTLYLLRLRAKNNLTYKLINQYKSDICRVRGFYVKMLAISVIPKWMTKLFLKLFDSAKTKLKPYVKRLYSKNVKY